MANTIALKNPNIGSFSKTEFGQSHEVLSSGQSVGSSVKVTGNISVFFRLCSSANYNDVIEDYGSITGIWPVNYGAAGGNTWMISNTGFMGQKFISISDMVAKGAYFIAVRIAPSAALLGYNDMPFSDSYAYYPITVSASLVAPAYTPKLFTT